jgi:hypothetical protein
MWRITGVEHPRPDFDGQYHRWNLERGGQRTFVLVKIHEHARMKVGDHMTDRSVEAVDTLGRSEVERHLADAVPPRVIEVARMLEPRLTRR